MGVNRSLISASTEPIGVLSQPSEETMRWHFRWSDPGRSVCIPRHPSPGGTSLEAAGVVETTSRQIKKERKKQMEWH